MKHLLRLPSIFLLVFGLSHLVFAQNSAVKTHEYTLKNGLKVVVREDHRSPVVVSQLWYRAGSSYESPGVTGVAHVLEHLMFKGTKAYPKDTFSTVIAENGGQENAFTSNDYTVYFQKLAADRLAVSLRMEADRMHNLQLLGKTFAKEMEVIKEERRMRVDDNPDAKTYERFLAAAHLASPYHHMVIGWMNDLQNMALTDAKNWYQKWYAPNNAILVVVGDVKPEAVLALAKQYFAQIPRTELPKIKPQRAPKSIGARQLRVEVPAKLPVLYMGFNTPSLLTAKKPTQAYALEVLAGILDAGRSARLAKQLIRGQQVASAARASYQLYARFDGLFTFEVVPARGKTLTEAKQALLTQIKKLQTELVSNKELDRVKAQVVANKVFAQDSLFGQGMEIGMLESVGLSWRDADNYVRAIRAVTADEVQQVARQYLTPKRMTTAELKPLALNQDVTGERHAS